MKKLLILVLTLAVLIVAAAPVLAAETGWGPIGPQGNYAGGAGFAGDGEPGWATAPGNSTGWGIAGDQGEFSGDGAPGWAGKAP